MSMFLKRSELQELTGYARPSGQRRWLVENAYPFELGADGYPRVLHAYVAKRLGGSSTSISPSPKKATPNFSAIMR
jgi:hypothetical protein